MFWLFWIFENWTDHTHGRRTDRHTDGPTTIANGKPEKPIKANECIKRHKHTQKWQEKQMQEKPYLLIFQGTQKDHKRHQLSIRHQFLLYYKRINISNFYLYD